MGLRKLLQELQIEAICALVRESKYIWERVASTGLSLSSDGPQKFVLLENMTHHFHTSQQTLNEVSQRTLNIICRQLEAQPAITG